MGTFHSSELRNHSAIITYHKDMVDQQEKLLKDLKKVLNRYNRSKNNTAIIENTYLQSIAGI